MDYDDVAARKFAIAQANIYFLSPDASWDEDLTAGTELIELAQRLYDFIMDKPMVATDAQEIK